MKVEYFEILIKAYKIIAKKQVCCSDASMYGSRTCYLFIRPFIIVNLERTESADLSSKRFVVVEVYGTELLP